MDITDEKIEIMPFEDRYVESFKQLNSERLKYYEFFETDDLEYLNKPWQVVIEPGGKILMAVINDIVVGSCAIIKTTNNTAEFGKLAISPVVRSKGIGHLLAVVSINLAQKMGFKKLVLATNKKLAPAVHLYESLGFKHATAPEDKIYGSTDVYMELNFH